jgi:hypothetical protein
MYTRNEFSDAAARAPQVGSLGQRTWELAPSPVEYGRRGFSSISRGLSRRLTRRLPWYLLFFLDPEAQATGSLLPQQ